MDQGLLLAALGAGGAYLFLKDRDAALSYPVGTEGAQPTYEGQGNVQTFLTGFNAKKGWTYGGNNYSTNLVADPGAITSQAFTDNEILARAKREFEALSESAKCAGLDKMKQLYAGRPEMAELNKLNCKSSYEAVAGAIGGTAGAAGASEGCKALGTGGAVVAPICSAAGKIVGTYIGENIDNWAKEVWDTLGDAMPWNW